MFCNKNKIKWDDFDGLRETVKEYVKEKRFGHILGVEREAVKIAEIYGCGDDFINKLRAAAILHDITKEFDYEKQLEICKKYSIKLSEDDKKAVKPVHAKTGAYIAKLEFGADNMIFDGILNHTLGDPSENFKLFDKIIYLADWLEPNRDYQDCIDLRGYFYSGIENAVNIEQKNTVMDKTLLFSYNKSIGALIAENRFIHKAAIKCRNVLINKKVMV